MMGYSLDTVLHLFQTGFHDFFEKIEIDTTKHGYIRPKGAAKWVVDVKNNIIDIHHFPEIIRLDVSHAMFTEKMAKRTDRMESFLKNAERIALVSYRGESIDEMSSFLKRFSEIYPHLTIRLINMRNDSQESFLDYKEHIIFDDGKLSYIDYTLNDTLQGAKEWFGNSFVWRRILANYGTAHSKKIHEAWHKFRKDHDQVIVYSVETSSFVLLNYFDDLGIDVNGIAVTSLKDKPYEINGMAVRLLSDYPKGAFFVLPGQNGVENEKIKNRLNSYGYFNMMLVGKDMEPIPAS